MARPNRTAPTTWIRVGEEFMGRRKAARRPDQRMNLPGHHGADTQQIF